MKTLICPVPSCRSPRASRLAFPRTARVALAMLTLLLAIGVGACGGSTSSLPPNTPVPPTGSQGRLLFTQGSSLWTLDLETAKKAEIVTPPELGQVH